MTALVPRVSRELVAMLRSRHDDDQQQPLRVVVQRRTLGWHIEVLRADGTELSELEARHCRATLAMLAS